jgi:hypothetical protein
MADAAFDNWDDLAEHMAGWLLACAHTKYDDECIFGLGLIARDIRALPAPPPSKSFSWKTWVHGHFGKQREGSLLEMLLDLGRYSIYAGAAREAADRKAVAALHEVGRALVERGVPDTSGLVEIAVDLGQRRLDHLGQLAACDAWGVGRAFDGPKAASLCARHASWHTHDGVKVWDWLLARGALANAASWTDSPQELQPAVCALQDRDWAGFKRAAKAGVALDWVDPASGATLWHFACVGGRLMSKNALPLLLASKTAPHLINAQTRADEDFGEKMWSIPAGSSALHCAAAELEFEAVRALLDAGANPCLADVQGRAPLHRLARKFGGKAQAEAEKIIRLLLEHGADSGQLDGEGRTPAQLMAAKAPLSALLPLLERRPEDVGGAAPAQKKAFSELMARKDQLATAAGEEAALRVMLGGSRAADALGSADAANAGDADNADHSGADSSPSSQKLSAKSKRRL